MDEHEEAHDHDTDTSRFVELRFDYSPNDSEYPNVVATVSTHVHNVSEAEIIDTLLLTAKALVGRSGTLNTEGPGAGMPEFVRDKVMDVIATAYLRERLKSAELGGVMGATAFDVPKDASALFSD